MVKTDIRVIIRARPTVNFANSNIAVDEAHNQVAIHIPKDEAQGYVNHQQEDWSFTFDKLLLNASQEVVFDLCAKDLVASMFEGYNGTIMCYGQTGAGKSFTVNGSTSDYKYRGVIPRCISQIYKEMEDRYDQVITVRVSYMEIYNEILLDLLAPAFGEDSSSLAIQEDSRGQVLVKGLTSRACANEEEALSMLFEGETNRTVTEHKLNKSSSRSHCVFSLFLEMRSRIESTEKVLTAKLNIVDLAGSERTKKTGSEGQTLLEAQFINKSLTFLEQVVVSLSEKHRRDHIPYRQSKLTYLLKDSIGGNSKTVMIANIWPEERHLEETISTLKFASRMMKVSNETSVNLQLDPNVLLKKYEREIRDLKQELAMHDTLSNRGRINYDPYSPDEQFKQQKIAKAFLENEIDDIEIESLRQVKELFFQFRNIYRNVMKDYRNLSDNERTTKHADEKFVKKATLHGKDIDTVGEVDNKFGFGVGKADKNSKPTTKIDSSLVITNTDKAMEKPSTAKKEGDEVIKEMGDTMRSVEKSHYTDKSPEKRLVNVDRNQVFQDFREKEGLTYKQEILKASIDLKERKETLKENTASASEIKSIIDELSRVLKSKEADKNAEEIKEGIIDEEEYEIMKEIKEKKKEYKYYFDKIKVIKTEIHLLETKISSNKKELLLEFEKFFKKKYGIEIADLENPVINEESEISYAHHSESSENEASKFNNAKVRVNKLQKARKQEKYK